ncbi:MAG: glycine zipper 2TM domain-containing protein [Pseudomonadota bacterium]
MTTFFALGARHAAGHRRFAAAVAACAVSLAGCASSYGANTVTPGAAGQAATVYEGTVTAVREIRIRPDNSVIGSATGAVLGGIAGSEIGGGDKAQTAGGVAGAVLGGLAGNEAGKAVNTRPGYAYTVRYDNGQLREIYQGADVYFSPGSRVNVVYRQDGARVVPAG